MEIEEKAKKGESMKIFSHRVFPQTHATACLTGETYWKANKIISNIWLPGKLKQ